MLAKMQAGASGYDLIFPSSYMIEVFRRNELIQEIDVSKIPNAIRNFDEKYAELAYDKTLRWSVPYAFSMTGICYRKDKVCCSNESSNSWKMILSPSCKGRVCILNDIREIIGIGLRCNDYSVNSTDSNELEAALMTMLKYKKASSKLDNLQYKTGIASGEFYICMGYNSDVLQMMSESDSLPVKFFIPKEGSTCCFDEMCLAKGSRSPDLALKLINYLYDPEVAARNARYICTAVPNNGMWTYMSEDEKSNDLFNIPEETLKLLEPIKDLGEKLSLYNKVWDKFKSAK